MQRTLLFATYYDQERLCSLTTTECCTGEMHLLRRREVGGCWRECTLIGIHLFQKLKSSIGNSGTLSPSSTTHRHIFRRSIDTKKTEHTNCFQLTIIVIAIIIIIIITVIYLAVQVKMSLTELIKVMSYI